jgi:hypothetical protein
VITHADLLVLNNLAKEIKKQERKEEESKRKMEECTFKPTTLPNSMNSSKVSSQAEFGQHGIGYKKSL